MADSAAFAKRLRQAQNGVVVGLAMNLFEPEVGIAHQVSVLSDGFQLAVITDVQDWQSKAQQVPVNPLVHHARLVNHQGPDAVQVPAPSENNPAEGVL